MLTARAPARDWAGGYSPTGTVRIGGAARVCWPRMFVWGYIKVISLLPLAAAIWAGYCGVCEYHAEMHRLKQRDREGK